MRSTDEIRAEMDQVREALKAAQAPHENRLHGLQQEFHAAQDVERGPLSKCDHCLSSIFHDRENGWWRSIHSESAHCMNDLRQPRHAPRSDIPVRAQWVGRRVNAQVTFGSWQVGTVVGILPRDAIVEFPSGRAKVPWLMVHLEPEQG